MKKETRIIEIAMSVFFMACHIIMILQMEPYAGIVYIILCTIFAISAWVLIGRLMWDKFKNDLK